MKLYLAEITVHRHQYPDKNWTEKHTRIVIAEDEDDAREKVEAAFNRESSYSYRDSVQSVDFHESIGGSVQVVS